MSKRRRVAAMQMSRAAGLGRTLIFTCDFRSAYGLRRRLDLLVSRSLSGSKDTKQIERAGQSPGRECTRFLEWLPLRIHQNRLHHTLGTYPGRNSVHSDVIAFPVDVEGSDPPFHPTLAVHAVHRFFLCL